MPPTIPPELLTSNLSEHVVQVFTQCLAAVVCLSMAWHGCRWALRRIAEHLQPDYVPPPMLPTDHLGPHRCDRCRHSDWRRPKFCSRCGKARYA